MSRRQSKAVLSLVATALLLPASIVSGAAPAFADSHHDTRVYKDCRHSSGTTGLVAGGVVGGVVGHSLIGGVGGTLVGVAGGALAGRAVDRSMTAKKRCRYYRR